MVFHMRPDLVILDIDTPRYSGVDFHEYLHTTQRGQDIPVLYLTRYDNWINREEANRLKAAGLLAKPCDKATLLTAVFRALGPKKQAARANGRRRPVGNPASDERPTSPAPSQDARPTRAS